MTTEFFDQYPSFYTTSTTASFPNRLNNRYKALIESNRALIDGKRILDVGSHDGRWSFAAIKNGASHVLGIEGRDYLVTHAINNMERYGVANDSYSFLTGDAHDEITKVGPNTIDVVFLFGFFYHTIRHMELLVQISRLNPQSIIIDTAVALSQAPIILLEFNNTEKEAAAIGIPGSETTMLVGRPSKLALEYFLSSVGFECEYFDWHKMNPNSWEHINDYYSGGRVTVVAKANDREARRHRQ